MYAIAVCNNHMMTDDGAVDGGTFITVTGTNFVLSDKVRCRWGQEIVEGTQLTVNEIQCISPAHAVGNVRFAISNNAQDFTTQNIQFTYQGMLHVLSCSSHLCLQIAHLLAVLCHDQAALLATLL